jgi:hypothetical protein
VSSVGIRRILACLAQAEVVSLVAGLEQDRGARKKPSPASLSQLPQLPQTRVPVRKVLTDPEDVFEERAAIIEYEGGLPRPMAEYLARRGRGYDKLNETVLCPTISTSVECCSGSPLSAHSLRE